MATESTAAAAAPAQPEAPIANPEERNAEFAKQLREEFNARDDETADTVPEKIETSTPAKEAAAVPDKQVSAKRIVELLKSWDEEAISKELGIDRKELKIRNSNFVNLRRDEKKAQSKINSERQTLEQERATLRQQREQFTQVQATLIEVAELVKNEDFVGAIEKVFGKPFDEVQKLIVQSSLDPSAKEIRRLRAEQDRRNREEDERKAVAQKSQQEQETAAARTQYITTLKTELFEDKEFGLEEFADHPKLPIFLNAVFNEQQKAYDPVTETTISAKKAAQLAIAILTAEAEAWSPYLTKFGAGAKTKTTEQTSRRGAENTASRSVARAQSGAPAPGVKDMSAQERFAYFGRQLRQEFSSDGR